MQYEYFCKRAKLLLLQYTQAVRRVVGITNKQCIKIHVISVFTFYMSFLCFNLFQSNFSANRILPSSYLFWVVKRLVDYL
jgi:hypothetical protein